MNTTKRRPALYPVVRDDIRAAGISVAAYVRHWFPNQDGPFVFTKWRGDACGCPDDRCIGHHHDEHEDCGCFPVTLAQTVTEVAR